MATDKRTARGLLELRKRYVRRAEYLCRDPEFVAAIREQARPQWGEAFPEFPLSDGPDNDRDMPASLCKALDDESAELSRARPNDRLSLILRITTAGRGQHVWFDLIEGIASEFWPERDYPRVSGAGRSLARFISACMFREPQALEWECDAMFQPFHLAPEPMTEQRGEFAFDGYGPDEIEAVTWCLPLYPGISAKDIREAAPMIERQAHRLYGARTATARIHALRAEGLTQREIAEHLGLTPQTVAGTLDGGEDA